MAARKDHLDSIASRLVAFALLACAGIAPAVAAGPGELDDAFGAAGRLWLQLGDPNDVPPPPYIELRAMAQQPDGKLVLVGTAQRYDIENDYSPHFLFVRLNADGTLDNSFDGDGWTTVDFAGADSEDRAYAVLVQPDGKIVAAGRTTTISPDYAIDVGLVRLLADGTPDPAFGTNGRVRYDGGGTGTEQATGIVRRSDGGFVIVGDTDVNGELDIFFAAFTSTGATDASFGTAGKTTVTFGDGSYEQAFALALQSDGKPVATGLGPGSGVTTMIAVRLTADGALDTSFDGDGLVVVDFSQSNAQGSALAIQPDGRIVLAGHADVSGFRRFAIARLTTAGELDNTFGTGGTVADDLSADWASETASGVAVQANGGIVVGGHLENALYERARDLMLVRYASDGSLDTGFGNQGVAIADFGSDAQVASAASFGLLQQSDGRLVVAGYDASSASIIARFDSVDGTSGGVLGFLESYSTATEQSGSLTFNLRRTGGSTGAVSTNVRLGVAGGAASAGLGCDFSVDLGPLSWADGDYADKALTVTILDDEYHEYSEVFELELYGPTGASLATTAHQVGIEYDAADSVQPNVGSVSIQPTATVSEGVGSVALALSRTNGSEDCAVVTYQTSDGYGQFPATAGSDYVASSGVVQFGAGDVADKQITIPIINDAVGEADETFGVTIQAHSVTTENPFAEVTIQDNDGGFPGSIYIFGGDGMDEESDGPQGGPITLVREGGSNGIVSVTYAVTSDTATAGTDFQATTGTVVWQSGDTSNKQVFVTIEEDTLEEPSETYIVTISNPTGGAILGYPTSVTQTIIDNDTLYPGEISCWAYTNPAFESAGRAVVSLLRTNGRDGEVSVDYATQSGSATSPEDFTVTSGTITWADQSGCDPEPSYACSGTPQRFVEIPIIDDALDEENETFALVLSNPTGGATIVADSSSCDVTIYKSDPAAGVLTITPLNQQVSEAGGSVTVSVTRSAGAQGAISIDYQTVPATADSDVDFTAQTGTLTWQDGESGAKTVTVPILDDALIDPSEYFIVYFSNVTGGAMLENPQLYFANVNIVDDEANPGTLDFATPVGVNEGAGTITLNVVRTYGVSGAVSVDYQTVPGTAQPPGDYTTTSGTLRWADGVGGFQPITIPITNDNVEETLESFTVHFSNVTGGAQLEQTDATIEINDDDDAGDIAMSLATVDVSETATTLNLTVTRSNGTSGTVSVGYATANGTATAGEDYTSVNGTISWVNGEGGPKTITIAILDDAIEESNEAFAVNLSDPTGGAQLQQASTTVTILDNDANPGQLRFTVATREVSEAAATVQIDVERFGGSLGAVSVSYATGPVSAVAGGDYTTTTGTLEWPDGDRTTRSFSIAIVNDTVEEPDETFTVALSNPTGGAVLATPSVETVTITNDDPANGVLELAVQGVTVTEGGQAVLQVTRSNGSGGAVQVDFETVDITAQAGADYTAQSGTLSWNSGDTTPREITVGTSDDSEDEPTETFYVRLSNFQGGADPGVTETVVSISDNDSGPAGTIAMLAPSVSTPESANVVHVVARRSGGYSGEATVQFDTEDFTALAGSDYTAQGGTLTWADWDTEDKVITIPLNDDTLDEPDETFNVRLSNATGAALGAATTVVTILDDDLPPVPGVLSVSGPSSVDESAASAIFTVSRAGGTDGAVAVDFATVAGTATEGSDYQAAGGTLSWASGDGTSRTVSVPIVNDALDEPHETFALSLSNPAGGATLGTASLSMTIIDDDFSGPGVIGIVANVLVFETVGNAIVSVQRTGGFDGAVAVSYATVADSAQAGQDFTGVSGTLQWADGDGTVKFITIPILNDTLPEAIESFSVTLSNPTNGATIGVHTGFVTIQDDDLPGTLAFTQTAQTVSESTASVTFSVSRNNGSRGAVTVDYVTVAGSAAEDSDYVRTEGTLSWSDGETTARPVTVPIINDTLAEFDESFTIVLSGASGGAEIGAADTATVTIQSDEVPVPGTVRMVSATATVNETAGSVVLYVERVSGSDGAVTIDYATVTGTATAADFTPTSGTLSWEDGDTVSKPITVAITNDAAYEEDETFAVTLSNPQGGVILASPSTTVTIQSEDAAVPGTLAFAVTAVSVGEPAGSATLSVTRSGGADGAVSVQFATAPGTATAADFTATSGALNWASGDAAAKSIVVPITNDALFEPDETFTVTLSNVTGDAGLGASTATVTIVSEDPPQRGTLGMAAASAVVDEDAGTVTLTVNRSDGTDGAVGVSWETAPGTATVADFGPAAGTLAWSDGDATPQTFTVAITDDSLFEADETFTVTLSDPTGGASLGATTTAVTIRSDDLPVTGAIRMASTAVSVDETAGSVTLTVERVGGSDSDVGVSYATATGTAGAADFTARSGSLTWANGDAAPQTITVPITDDTAFEADETFTVVLSNVTGGAALGTPTTTTVTIVSEDPPQRGTLAMAAATASVAENLGSVSLSVTRSGGADGIVTVDYASAAGTAGAADFTAVGGTLTWANGDAAAKIITVPVTNDTLFEPNETFTVTLSNVTGGAALGASSTTVTIVSEDPPQRGTIALSSATLTVAETAGTVTISVARTGGSDGEVGVSYSTTAGTASTADFTTSSGTLSWGDGETGEKTFAVGITDDALVESDEVFAVTLSAPTGGASLGTASTTVTIRDDDVFLAPGVLGLTQAAATVSETAGTVTFTVARASGLGGAVTVDYATASGTATSGSDFVQAQGTLTWAAGEGGGKEITINLVDDTAAEPDETFTLTLSNPGGGATLGTALATITLQSEDIPPDTTPDAFTFSDQTDLPIGAEVTSNEITVSGINAPAPISIEGGQYSVDGGPFASAAATVASGARVRVRVVASSNYSTTVSATLNIGGVTDAFSVTTRDARTATKVKAKSGLGSFGGSGLLLLGALWCMRRRRAEFAAACVLLCGCALSPAATAGDSGIYLAAGAGTTEVAVGAGEVARRLEGATGEVISAVKLDEQDFGYFLRAGYGFNAYLALEVAYHDFGTLEAQVEAEVLDLTGFARQVAKAFPSNVHGPAVSLAASWPFAGQFAAQARAGWLDWSSDVEVKVVSGGSGTYHAQDDGSDLIWGIGLAWRPTGSLDVSLEFIQAELDDAVRALQLGFTWRTGWLSR